jgi:hypothetical protein
VCLSIVKLSEPMSGIREDSQYGGNFMALINCRECGKEISDLAAACPHCGAPLKVAAPSSRSASSNTGCLAIVGGLAVIFLFGAMIRGCASSSVDETQPTPTASSSGPPAIQAAELKVRLERARDPSLSAVVRLASAKQIIDRAPNSAEAAEAQKLMPDLVEAASKEAEMGSWDYYTSQDPMSDKPVHVARVQSENSFQFDFPYSGPQHATLTLRSHPKWGKDVIFAIERGQILCHSYNCPVRVRFDDEPAKTYTGNEPADNSSDAVFVPAYSTFMAKLAKAKRVRIEVNVYKQGTLTTEFKVKGFDRSKL